MKQNLVKICGINNADNLTEIVKLNPNFVGFIFHPQSVRYVGNVSTNIINEIKNIKTQKVGVFVNADVDTIFSTVQNYGLDYVQLHGNEKNEIARILHFNKIKIIKSIPIQDNLPISYMRGFVEYIEYFLFDTATPQFGGSGKTFDWHILKNYYLEKPFLLSGGLGMHNITNALSIDHPMLAGFDINSKIEIEPGVKNLPLTQEIINSIHK